MHCRSLIAGALMLGLASAALAQGSAPPNDDRPPQNSNEPRFDPRNGPPRGPMNPNMSEAPFTPRRDFGPPPGYDPRQDARPDPRDTRRDPPRQERRPEPRDTARRAPPPPPKSHADRRPAPREDARRAPPSPRDHRDARRQDPQFDRRYDRRDERDRAPPPRDVARRDERDRGPPRRDYRDDPRYDRRGPPPRDYRDARREPPRRDYRDRRDEPPHLARNNPVPSSEHRRALLREYERNARRQYEIERELGGGPSRLPSDRDRYSDAGPYRR